MPYTVNNPPDRIKSLPKHAQRIWISAYNSAYKQYDKNEERSNKVAWAAVKKIYKKVGDKWVKKKASSFMFPICLSNAKIKNRMTIHILPMGEWDHAFYGKIKIQQEDIEEFIQNFYKGIVNSVPVTQGHDGGLGSGELPAIGWFKELLDKGKKGLWGIVEWTEKGRELLEQKAFKYFSPEFYSVYEDPETHKVYNNVLTGGALTNSPYFKELKSIVMSEPIIIDQFEEKNIMSKEIKENKKDLSEENEKEEENTEESEESKENEGTEEKTEEKTEEGTESKEENKEESEEITEKKEEDKKDLGESEENEEEEEEEKELTDTEVKATYREPKKNLLDNKRQKGKKVVYQVMNSGSVQLSEKENLSEFKKELLRVGEWLHGSSKNGVLKITKKTLDKIVKNFKDKVLDNVMVPLGHPTSDDPSKNVGEVKDLKVSNEKLMATIDVKNKSITDKIKDGLIKGISASIVEDYTNKDTGKKVGPTLFHAALVNEPYIKGMADFVPLSEELKGSLVIPIFNMEEPLTMEEISSRITKIEEKIGLGETEEEVKTEEVKKEEVEKEEISKETSEEESSKEETSEETTDKSSEVGEKTEKEEEKEVETEETKTEETKTEETKPETEEAKKGVDLAEAEKMFDELLELSKVTPAEKELLVPLLSSNITIELSEGVKVESGKALYEYLKKQSPKFFLSEEGTSETSDKKERIPEDVKKQLDKMDLAEEDQKDVYKDFKGMKEKKETTPF